MSDAISLRTPKYRHHKGKNLAVVTLAGRDVYLGKYGSAASKIEYRRLVAEYLQRGGISPESRKDEITVAEVMAAYLAHARSYYQKGGKQTREYGHVVEICRAIKPLYGKAKAVEFGPIAFKAVRQTFIDADIVRRHINKQTDRIKRMFRWAAAEELIPASIPQALSMVAGLRNLRDSVMCLLHQRILSKLRPDAILSLRLKQIKGKKAKATTGTNCKRCEYLLLEHNRCNDLRAKSVRSRFGLSLQMKCFSVRGMVSHNLEVVGSALYWL